MACNTNALSGKIVINVCDARKLGHISNYELDLCDGRITAVFVPGECGFLGFSRGSDIRIPWDKIRKIGEDAILVEIPPRPVECSAAPPKKKKLF
ncbi:MAG: YlmC/YmxH family sporulation protein [Clostridia bacterium]|nr:YlmC/YmxH family sporulation protein [Clostridia bacterium]